MKKKTKWLCERHTDLKTGLQYDLRKGMDSKTIWLMFGDEKFDYECLKDVHVETVSETCYIVECPICGWKYKAELVAA